MDRKAWIVIIVCLGGLFWSQYDLQKRSHALQVAQAAQAAQAAQEEVAKPTDTAPLTSAATPAAVDAVSTAPIASVAPAATAQLRTSVAEYTVTSAGGIQQIELLGHKAENSSHVVINGNSEVPIGAISNEPGKWAKSNETLAQGEHFVALESILPSGLQIKKTFTTAPAGGSELKDVYQIKYDITFSNPGVAKVEMKPWFVSIGSAQAIHEHDQPHYTTFDYQAGAKTVYKAVSTFDAGKIPLIGIQTSAEKSEIRESFPGILWAGTKNQYFSTMLLPLGNLRGTDVWVSRFELPLKRPDAPKQYAITGALGFPAFSLNPGDSRTESFTIYAGPKEFSRLKTLGSEQQGVMEFGFFGFFSSTLLQAMNWLHSFVGNYGIAIILLTLIIKTGLWTIQNKSMKSMKKMSLLAPKMTELKEKYKDDPTRMNQEVMKLYKDYGVNPFAGCLPMLVQMPIFFGFYSMLAVAVELRNSSFLWVDDLSQPDTVGHLFGLPVNIFPLVMAGTMLWQMQLTPKTGDSSQQKIFMFMPIFFLFICYNYASALALYWTVQNIFSIVQLYLTRNAPLPELVKVNAVPANAKAAKLATKGKR